MIRYYVFTEPPEFPVESPLGLFRVIEEPGYLEAERVGRSGEWVEDGSLLRDLSGASAETGIEKVDEVKAREILEGWDFVESPHELIRESAHIH